MYLHFEFYHSVLAKFCHSKNKEAGHSKRICHSLPYFYSYPGLWPRPDRDQMIHKWNISNTYTQSALRKMSGKSSDFKSSKASTLIEVTISLVLFVSYKIRIIGFDYRIYDDFLGPLRSPSFMWKFTWSFGIILFFCLIFEYIGIRKQSLKMIVFSCMFRGFYLLGILVVFFWLNAYIRNW